MKFFPIAIIGSGCVYSPDGYDVNKFWKNILSGKSGIMQIPSDRWNYELYYDSNRLAQGKSYCKYGAYVVDYVVPDRLGLSQDVRTSLNRSQLFLLDSIDQALRQAGLDLNNIPDERIVFGLANMLGDEALLLYSLRYRAKEVLNNIETCEVYHGLSATKSV